MGRFFQIFGGSIFGLFLLISAVLLNQWFEFAPGGGNEDYGVAESLEDNGARIDRDEFGDAKVIILPEHIGDDDLRDVAELRSLVEVTFENPWNITDRGISHLTSLRELQILRLSGADITDACTDDLASMQELRELLIDRTGISSGNADYLNLHFPYGSSLKPIQARDVAIVTRCGRPVSNAW